jgi:hypothetical protein
MDEEASSPAAARMARQTAWRREEGKARSINRGGLDRADEGMTTEMRPWHGGLGRRAYGGRC